MSETCYVFDTNVIISALLFDNGKPAQALRYALTKGKVLLSLELLAELDEVLERKRFDRYVTHAEREEFLAALVERTVFVEIVVRVQECRDQKDDKVLEVALNGKAQSIISGDRDLLVMHPFRDINVVTAEEFLRTMAFE